MAASTASKSFTGVNRTVIPCWGRIASNWVNVPPYKLFAETISSPSAAMFVIVK